MDQQTRPSLLPLMELTAAPMADVNAIIMSRMQSEIELIPSLAGHLIASGGKRIRPMVTLAAALMVSDGTVGGGMGEDAAKLAAAVEFIHTATLLHDDVIDASALRRGRQTANAIWGNEASVLVGDFLFARAFELMVETGNLGVLGRLARASSVISEGEIQQLLIAGVPDTDIADYLRVIVGKTAELFAAAAESGALICGGDAATCAALRDYGMALGIAFQIADDALDYAADEADLGKTVGDDFAEGKITLPVMLAYRAGDDKERSFWQRTLGDGDITPTDLVEAQKLLLQHNAIALALLEAGGYANKAEKTLKIFPDSPARSSLILAARFAVHRNQ